jgi:mannose-1-phosphate guanylyltransferase/mannose-6-phosphate isomerase
MEAPQRDMDFIRPGREAFAGSPADSIDFAVMEHTSLGVVAPLLCDWNDLGNWSALAGAMPQDEHGNTVRGDVVTRETTGSLLYSEDRLLAAIGIADAVVVATPDAVLVARKDCDAQLKQLVTELKARGRSETAFHTRVHRPWGSYEGIGRGDRYQVKRIRVRPGASLSLQMHHHRAEHWVVVRGTARIQRGEEQIFLAENESVFIPLGVRHRLENPGLIELELIEVQSGSYLGEDDIVRFEDHYGR